MAEVVLDLPRSHRIGIEEAVYAGAKSVAQLETIFDAAQAQSHGLFLTRLAPAQLEGIKPYYRGLLDYDPLSRTAVFLRPRPALDRVPVAVLMGGLHDMSAGREAVRTLAYYGQACLEHVDVNTASLARLVSCVEEIRTAPAVIVAAGLDPALVSVVAGLVPGMVIALTTSAGLTAPESGMVALQAALASCAPGIAAVNIDNGYGAACAVLRMLNAAATVAQQPLSEAAQ